MPRTVEFESAVSMPKLMDQQCSLVQLKLTNRQKAFTGI